MRTPTDKVPLARLINFFGFAVCVSSIAIAVFYLEGVLYLDPCPLCIIDRVLVIAMGAVFLVTALHNPGRLGQRVYGSVNLVVAATGLGVGARHIWLQHMPPDQVPECGPGLEYMLETLPLNETIANVFRGSGECAEIQWTFLGLSIPEQVVALFLFLALLVLLAMFRKPAA